MAKKKTWLCNKDCFGSVDGQWQRLKEGKTYKGHTVHPECDFTLLIDEPNPTPAEPATKPKKVPMASEKSRKKELRRLIRKKGGQCTNFDSLKKLQEKYDAIK